MKTPNESSLEVFSTCPQSRDLSEGDYRTRVIDVARWSERNGYTGILVYSDNGLVDPWLVSQIILQNTARLCPLVAVQPVYMHPYTAAKMIASFGHLYGRRIFLNMVAGGFRNDLAALGDATPHDDRYERLVEYTLIVKKLLESATGVSFEGRHYQVKNAKMTPPLAPDLFPGLLISGSSEAGLAAAARIGATAVKYPGPSEQETGTKGTESCPSGIRVGIIARPEHDEAWRIARERFPEDRKGQLTHQLAVKTSDSAWHRELSEMGETASPESPYWLVPFQNYKTFCPYLVGSYQRVAQELALYFARGFRTVILDIPPSEEDLRHTGIAFDMALGRER